MKKDFRAMLLGVLLPSVVFTYIFLLISFPEVSAKGVTEGLKLSAEVLIPTLFPFMAVSGFFVNSGYLMRERKSLTFLSEKLFLLGNAAFPVLILSLLGGYPVGAKTVTKLYKKGYISKNESRRIMLFAVNPSMSFVISTVGYGMYRNLKCGIIMFFSVVLSALTLAFAGRFFKGKNSDSNGYRLPESELKPAEALTLSVKESSFSMMYICAYVVLFSSLSELFGTFLLNDGIGVFLRCILEVSVGSRLAFQNFSMPQVCALLSFGGLSTAFQIMSFCSESGVSFTEYILSRFASAFLSGVYCNFLLRLFPVSAETFSGGNIEIITSPSYSFSVSVCLVLMAILFIMGDSIIGRKALTEKVSLSKINEE